MARVGDIVKFGPRNRPHRIVRTLGGKIAVMQEMAKDKLGRLRSIGEEGRFSTTVKAAFGAPLFRR